MRQNITYSILVAFPEFEGRAATVSRLPRPQTEDGTIPDRIGVSFYLASWRLCELGRQNHVASRIILLVGKEDP